jgi:hypothetical protein
VCNLVKKVSIDFGYRRDVAYMIKRKVLLRFRLGFNVPLLFFSSNLNWIAQVNSHIFFVFFSWLISGMCFFFLLKRQPTFIISLNVIDQIFFFCVCVGKGELYFKK